MEGGGLFRGSGSLVAAGEVEVEVEGVVVLRVRL